jgi:multiple sugar transport system permease protein
MILQYMKNSVVLVSISIILVLLISIPAAFALSRYRFQAKRPFLFLILVFQMLSPVVIVIPLYRLFMSLGIYNELWSLIVVYSASSAPFTVWYLKGYFDTIPHGLDEAARIDGASPLRTLLSVHIPIAVPGIASTAILLAVQTWSHFVFPSILLDDKKLLPISVGLLELQSSSEAITVHYLAASSIIAVLPVLLCFIVFQKFIVSALTQGAIKE